MLGREEQRAEREECCVVESVDTYSTDSRVPTLHTGHAAHIVLCVCCVCCVSTMCGGGVVYSVLSSSSIYIRHHIGSTLIQLGNCQCCNVKYVKYVPVYIYLLHVQYMYICIYLYIYYISIARYTSTVHYVRSSATAASPHYDTRGCSRVTSPHKVVSTEFRIATPPNIPPLPSPSSSPPLFAIAIAITQHLHLL